MAVVILVDGWIRPVSGPYLTWAIGLEVLSSFCSRAGDVGAVFPWFSTVILPTVPLPLFREGSSCVEYEAASHAASMMEQQMM
jgi:hypothetical protein